ncbi:STM4015 family protein [Micromonospora fluostatini]|uniref:STM4015 family protein n=1 Tax=Micromonospora sp. JCM 30529 TaxID=3421643 RepID=UPI003D16C175
MTFSAHATTFAGRPVVEVPVDGPLPTVEAPVAWRLSVPEYDTRDGNVPSDAFAAAFERFVAQAGPQVEALVVGAWGYAAFNTAPIAQLRAAAPRLPALRALFLGDMIFEECEISWMMVGDVSPLLTAYPALEVLRVRGGQDFRFSPVRHAGLRELAVESGGLAPAFVHAVLDSDLPALTDLELWLGDSSYGGDTTGEDLAPLLAGERFPALRRLRLRNAEHADDLAEAVATAPVLARLERLDMSMGTLGDRGARALLAGGALTHLAELDLHRHYVTEQVAAEVAAGLPGVRVDLSDPQEEDDDEDEEFRRYVAVAE